MPEIHIRPATSDDVEALCRLYYELHECHARGVPDHPEAEILDGGDEAGSRARFDGHGAAARVRSSIAARRHVARLCKKIARPAATSNAATYD